MLGQTTNFVVRRGKILDFIDLTVTAQNQAGLRVRDYMQFTNWVGQLKRVAVVTGISPGSPAAEADIQLNDLIVWCRRPASPPLHSS